jgi:predicted MPP superfamily phosphohydrolase
MASDLHIGYHNTRKELARWVDMINAENPDFILIAGDIIDGSMRPVIEERMDEEFRRSIAKAGQKKALQLVQNQSFDDQIATLLCE